MSYPTRLKLFKAWAKAMEEGATVDKPDYGKNAGTTKRTPKFRMKSRRKRRRNRRRSRRLRKRVTNG